MTYMKKADTWYHFWKCRRTHRFCVAETRTATAKHCSEFYMDPIYKKHNKEDRPNKWHFDCDAWFMRINFTFRA